MLRRSFVHIAGIGPAKERRLWDSGILDWSAFKPTNPRITEELKKSERALAERDLFYFYQRLPRGEIWRLLPGNLADVAYLDIETTGLGGDAESTTVTFVFRGELYQEHEPRKKIALIRKMLKECSLLCTFFGEVFDVPFLARETGIEFDKAHIDLCFWLKRHGLRGGLKRIQKEFPEIPARLSLDIDGFDAIRLWRMHERGVEGALETLLAYNAEDTIVLEPLLIRAWDLERAARPELNLPALEARPIPELSTRIHESVYGLLRGQGVAVAAPN